MIVMATIRPNDNAPAEEAKYIFAAATFDLAPGGSYETDDRSLLSDAEIHPWLEVEYPEVDEAAYARESKSVPYEDDALAAVNSVAFDADEIRKVEEAKQQVVESRLAVQAGLAQTKPVEVAGVAVTLAADESNDEENDKPARRKSRTADKEN
jgi:hypothetical protein